jgi:hypothetical protein
VQQVVHAKCALAKKRRGNFEITLWKFVFFLFSRFGLYNNIVTSLVKKSIYANSTTSRQGAVTFSSVVSPRAAQHPVDLLDKTLLWLPFVGQHLAAEIVEGILHLADMLGGGYFEKFTLKVFG